MRIATIIVLSSLLLAAAAAAQQVYRWVDEDGVVHYSDQPPPNDGAQAIDIEVPPGISNPSRAIAAGERPRPARSRERDDETPTETIGGYRNAAITEPESQEVLWNIATRLPVAMRLEPALAGSHRIQWLLDGEPIGEPVSSLRTTLEPVYRGTHTLTATVVNADGNTVYSTDPLTFYVQQATVFRR